MEKGMITAGILSIIACAVTAYGWAAGRENTSEEITATEIVSERRIESAANAVNGKSLVVYFSVPETDGVDASSGASCVLSDGEVMGNTQYVAAIISEATGSDLFEIKTVHTYPGSHKALIDAAKVETDNKARPKLATHIENLQDYDVVFVGFPNWWYDMPMPIYSFLEEYDFSGKTIIPFVTSGGSGFSSAISTIEEMESGATVIEGISIGARSATGAQADVEAWLTDLGYLSE